MITDFDEIQPRFAGTACPLVQLMDPTTSLDVLERLFEGLPLDVPPQRIESSFETVRKLEVIMGDKYENRGQVAAFGAGATAHGATFNQTWIELSETLDSEQLADELRRLRLALKTRAATPEEDLAVAEIAAAELAAGVGDGVGALKRLANAGVWALNAAKDIGVGVAAAAIQAALGLPRA